MVDLLMKLRQLFEIFIIYNISIKPIKTYLNYPNISLLGQRVNSLSLTMVEEKLKVIQLLCYPNMLSVLEYYLSLTNYLCSYIYLYAQFAEPLQLLNTAFLKDVPVAKE